MLKKWQENIKALYAVSLSIGLTLGSVSLLASCDINASEMSGTQSSSVVTPPASESAPSDGNEIVVETVLVSEVIDEKLGTRDYRDEFNSSILNVVGEKYGILNLVSIDFDEVTIAEEGKITLSVVTKSAENGEAILITYEGDTTKYETFYRLAYEKDELIAEMLTGRGLTLELEIAKNSTVQNVVEGIFAKVIADFDSGKKEFENISAEDFKEPEPPKEIVYVSVRSIVDEVFKDVDVDADIKETAQTIFTTKAASTVKMKKLLAFDYDKETGNCVIYNELQSSSGSKNINSLTIENIYSTCPDYLDMASNMEEYIAEKIADKGINLTDQIEEGSTDESELISYFEGIREEYKEQKSVLESTQSSKIIYKGLFSIADFDSTKMSELGITSMNAFAEALLNNENGDGYDQVTGWTIDDVIATYVSEFNSESIDYVSRTNILIVTSNGIYDYSISTQRYYGNTTDRYSMILTDDPNVYVTSAEQVASLSSGSVVFDENGQRIEKQNETDTVS